ncbi:hypothetical protein LSUE1_G006280 [Lachnellula suecica]|uniref:Uncharacterized protein n=1 Tax=Lachnellula suecica TaxID=602035 RepID=A0A8T9CED7_9HELO|nr:hypothetical protein LSUE1_G006280 [Lachnellula suecica]
MSLSNYSYSSSSTFTSSSSNGGQRSGQAYKSTTSSDPSGTRVQTTSQTLGEPAMQETRHYNSEGKQILEGGRVLGQGNESAGNARRIEDVTDENNNDREYRDRMEDEYAKREGGA